jgi:peptidyl-prolyl cis-trans isomerase SurA
MKDIIKMTNMTDWQKYVRHAIAAAGLCALLIPAGIAAQTAPAQTPAQTPAQAQGPSTGESSSESSSAPQSSPDAQSSNAMPKASSTPAGGAPEDPASADTKGTVIEEIVARVNDDIITRSDLDRAREDMVQAVHDECTGCTDADIQSKIDAQEPDLLRGLIDQSLLVQRAKDDDINVEADVVKKLDEIRQQNHIASMEDLERQIDASGMDFEDYKTKIRNQLLTREVISKEVGSRVIVDHTEVLKYYNEHQDEFQRPEQVALREIIVSTDGKTPDEITALQKKAQGLLDRVRGGDDFGQLAIHFSDGPTAKEGGDLGTYERGQLAPDIENQVFKLDRNQTTDVIQTKTGFLILQVEQRYEAGLQPLDKVEDEITDKLYTQKMEPQLRDYLKQLRQDSFVEVKPGYVDTAAVASTQIQEVSAIPDDTKKVKAGHRFLFFGKKKPAAQGT